MVTSENHKIIHKTKTEKFGIAACLALIALLIDQLSKAAMAPFLVGKSYTLVPYLLSLNGSWNRGVSFSLFEQKTLIGSLFLVGIATLLIAGLLIAILRSKSVAAASAFGLILGGALGNVLDRIRFGAVFDYLHLHAGRTSFFICNGADIFITLGLLLLLVSNYIERKNALP